MRMIITGGGTGGHLFPAVAVAKGIQSCTGESEILFIGTSRHLDNSTLTRLGFVRKSLNFSGVKGLGISGFLKAGLRLFPAVLKAVRMLRLFRPDIVFGVGGYVTVPVVLAARILRIPVCIHEQNVVPGLANRLNGKLADKVCISMECLPPFPVQKTILTGNPVREEIILAGGERSHKADNDGFTLLVLGGSQGAHSLNELMVEAAPLFCGQQRLTIIHQSGLKDEEMVGRCYGENGIRAEVSAFFNDMAKIYSRADLVISRAGATTLAELAVMGLPAILIPYPFATDDHQSKNAQLYVDNGAALLLAENNLGCAALAEEINKLLTAHGRMVDMGRQMKKMGRVDATEKIIAVCRKLGRQEIGDRRG
jgi:UDP-N-acetylglucosamine--N-acetylmuramyl-(pentapeptide) pyrophosphoryl-undecaprenol N-acetylglucosamine transferase